MAYLGRYINLDRSTGRRRALEERLAALGCAERYTRFPAIDGSSLDRSRTHLTPGECGCFESHYRCIKESMDQDLHLHIIEDDVVFGPRTTLLLDQTIEDGLHEGEMMFTDIFVPGDLASMVQLMNYYRLSGILAEQPAGVPGSPKFVNFLDLKHMSFAGSSSYVLRSGARGRMLELMEEELALGPADPIDIFFNKIVRERRFTATCTLPFLSSVDVAAIVPTTIEGRTQHDLSALAFFMLRNYFFVDKNEEVLSQLTRELTASLDNPSYMDTVLDAFRFIFSKNFVAF